MTDSAPVTREGSTPTITNRKLRALLKRLGACSEARDWLGQRDGATAWAECERGDWMLWACARVGVDRRLLVRAAVACAQPAVTAYVPASEPRPQAALDAALAWADDPSEANLDRVRVARRNADAYADADDTTYAAAAYAAADAAYAAYAAAPADAAYAYAAAAYADAAAAYAAADAARATSLRESARIVRELIPLDVVLAAVRGEQK